MSEHDRIKEGDRVTIALDAEGNNCETGVLFGTPQDTGDSWKLKRDDGCIVYVQTYSAMYRVKQP